MDRKLWLLISFFLGGTTLTVFLTPSPMMGLSSVLGTIVITSTVLGTSVLGTPVIASSALTTAGLAAAIAGAYTLAIQTSGVFIGGLAVCLILFSEATSPSYGELSDFLRELRPSWLPATAIASVLLAVQAAVKVLHFFR